MAVQSRGLGRGIDALLGGARQAKSGPEVTVLSLDAIRPNPRQPRTEFDQAALEELSQSIRNQGVLQPILVRPAPAGAPAPYELVAGERRFRASQLAGLKEIPALVRDMNEEESLAIALVENLQRENLSPVEEARGLAQFQAAFKLSQEELARRMGKSRPAVSNALRLLQLPEYILQALSEGRLTAGHARTLLVLTETPDAQRALFQSILDDGLSVRQVERLANHYKEHGGFPEPEPAAPRPARRPTRPAPPPPFVLQVRDRLRQSCCAKAAIKGDADKGRIVLPYDNPDELRELLARLGCAAQDPS